MHVRTTCFSEKGRANYGRQDNVATNLARWQLILAYCHRSGA